MAPSEVIPGDQASLQAFWQQMLDHARSQPAFFRDSGLQASQCTWTQFRTAVLTCDTLPLQLLSSLYDEQFIVTAILGSQSYLGPKGRGCTTQYHVSWASTIMCACHVDACEKLYRGKVVNITNLPHGEAPLAFLECTPQTQLVSVEWDPSYCHNTSGTLLTRKAENTTTSVLPSKRLSTQTCGNAPDK